MRRRTSSSFSSGRGRILLVVLVLSIFTYFNYKFALSSGAQTDNTTKSSLGKVASHLFKPSSKASSIGISVEDANSDATKKKRSDEIAQNAQQQQGSQPALDPFTSPPDPKVYNTTYEEALSLFEENLGAEIHEDVKQPTKDFVDVPEHPDNGILLPHDPTQVAPEEQWRACDPRNAEFTTDRDALCQQYLSNWNNMRSIKALSAILKRGRTIKYKIFYHHNNIQAIVKVSQMKFVFEPVSEYLAYALDRELNFTRTPIAAYVPLPLDYMKAASAIISPFYSQWFKYFILDYEFTNRYFVSCPSASKCSLVTIQLWMSDVHSALYTSLAVPYEYDEHFAEKFYTPGYHKWPPKPLRLRALGDINIRFIFDFLMGNTDRGMNDHNNFVYGGCDETTRCAPEPENERTKGIAKYAFIDHGSSFYSRKEPEENPFTGNLTDILICRYRRSTYDLFKAFEAHEGGDSKDKEERYPLVMKIKAKLPKNLFRIVSFSVFQHVQIRLEKVLKVMRGCIERYGESEVLSLPEYWEV